MQGTGTKKGRTRYDSRHVSPEKFLGIEKMSFNIGKSEDR